MSRSEAQGWPPPALQDGGGPIIPPPPTTGTRNSNSAGQKRRNLSLANITIPSAFTNLSILKRKPLPANSPVLAQQRSLSLDSPTLPYPPRQQNLLTPIASPGQAQFVVRDLDNNPHGNSPLIPLSGPIPTSIYSPTASVSIAAPSSSTPNPPPVAPHHIISSAPVASLSSRHDQYSKRHSAKLSLSSILEANDKRQSSIHRRSSTMTTFASRQSGLHLRVETPGHNEMNSWDLSGQMPTTPKSPARKLSNFFGFKTTRSPNADSPSTHFSDSMPVSPLPSDEYGPGARLASPAALDIAKANMIAQGSWIIPQTPSLTLPVSSAHMAELEQELQEISAELANSIKREMELEDEVERMKAEPHAPITETNRRTSDYYSDSGAGSVRYPFGENDGKLEQLERLRRQAEQDKAQLKLDMSQRLQDALRQRREIEERAQTLHEHLQTQTKGQVDNDRVRELEASLVDFQRRLGEERQFRENFQDLVAGMRDEIEQYRLERDNLRDEVVPQMRARIDGLESDASQSEKLTYDHTRMQQELQALKDENQTLVNARRMQMEMQQQQLRFGAISEEGLSPMSPNVGSSLSRSKSFANKTGRTSRSNSASGPDLLRGGSVKEKTYESREALTQKVKDIETQRDALHKALKSMLDRHTYNERRHAKKLRQLEMERDKFMSLTPRRTAFHSEIKHLKDEVSTLRRRGDDALDQKWRCEKGLGGLKMDLDRAQEETSSLRSLLQERDIFIPDRPGSQGTDADSSGSLDKAYGELRTTQALSIARIKEMEAGDGSFNVEANRTLELLKQSISDAESERDRAQSQAEDYRQQAQTLRKSELEHLGKQQNLAAELYASAQRMDELASQVQVQLQSNSHLRQRLAEAIERGERDQKSSKAQISQMQRKLRELEDKLMAAQQHSEETVNRHETEVREMTEAHNAQLQRATTGALTPLRTDSLSLFAARSPRLDNTSSGFGISIAEATKTNQLEKRVQELEKALTDADKEMGEVVSRMNIAQMEVAELQSERDEATQRSRKLQAEMVKEREKVQLLMTMGAGA
ncbi:hypothetical protein EJ08DRAFT_649588 [Tothia fuscella]|uniref:DUF7603 domain-containing protein n=1 Tax=Tothia fuscella TaxID=1048955 RepID=A0A9P4NSR5_9PEZI|nr:hypothetical protein EJ08DRAFT_649588 [Tothia fuscella]